MKMKNVYTLALALLAGIAANAQSWKLAGNALTGAEKFGSTNSMDLKFYTNNAQRMTIFGDGKIGFGTANPLAKFNFYGLTRIDDSLGLSTQSLLILNGRSSNALIDLRTNDTTKTIFGYDQSGNSFNINVTSPYISSISVNRATGNVLIGSQFTPASKITLANSTSVKGDLTVEGINGLGDLFFTYYQQGIRFPTFSTAVENSAMIYMTDQPTANSRMVLSHSKTYSNWGLQYDDATDQFNFLGAGTNRMAINLSNGRVGIGVASPAYTFDVTGTSRFTGNIGVQTAPNTRTIQCGITQGALIGIGTAEYIQDAGISTLSAAANWLPVTDNAYSIGSSSFRWKDVWAVDGTINTSDARDKSNIKDLSYGLKEIMKLRAVKFNWKANPNDGDKLGVIAQEIQKVLPEVVRDYTYKVSEETGKAEKVKSDRLGVMYSDIIPVLIKGMQEQQQMIEDLQQQLNDMKNAQAQTSAAAGNAVTAGGAVLEQNIPNPVKTATVIRYNTGNSKNPILLITDNNGNTIKQITLNTGAGNVTVDCSNLASGIYTYSIIADGKTITSKKMAVAK